MVIGLAVAGATSEQRRSRRGLRPVRIIWPIPAEVVGRDVSVAQPGSGLRSFPPRPRSPTDLHAHFIIDGAYEVVEGAPFPQQCGVLPHRGHYPAGAHQRFPPGEPNVEYVIRRPRPRPGRRIGSTIGSPSTVAENPDAVASPRRRTVEKVTRTERGDHLGGAGSDHRSRCGGAGRNRPPCLTSSSSTMPIGWSPALHSGAGRRRSDTDNPVTIEGLVPGQHTIARFCRSGPRPGPALARPQVTLIVGEAGANASCWLRRDVVVERE